MCIALLRSTFKTKTLISLVTGLLATEGSQLNFFSRLITTKGSCLIQGSLPFNKSTHMQKVDHVQDTIASSSQLKPSLKEHPSSKATHGIDRGLFCHCLTVQLLLLPCPTSLLSQRCRSQSHFTGNFLHANLYFRVCFPGSLICENSFGPNQATTFCFHLIISDFDGDLYISHGRLMSEVNNPRC